MVLFYALIIGLLAGLAGAGVRVCLSYIEGLRNAVFNNVDASNCITWLWPLLFSVTGVSVALYLVKKYAPEASGSGVHEIEGALSGVRPMLWRRVLPVKFIGSIFSLGSGLLLGREGPTIQIGANIGEMVQETLSPDELEGNPLVSAGAAAGLSAAFNAPLSGIIFIIEEMQGHFRFNFYSVAAIMIGSGSADFVVRTLVAARPTIDMMVFTSPDIYGIWLFVLLGLLFSIIGFIFNKVLILGLDFFQHTLKKVPVIFIAICVGLVIATAGMLSPEMIGGGYGTIAKVLDDSFTLSFLLFLFLARMVLTIFSYSSGVPGGIFAPLLTLGVIFGMLFGIIMQELFPSLVMNPGVFAVAGMAAIFSATVRAPLTGLVLAIEMTSNYELIFPLIVTTVTASVCTTLLGNQPIYTTLLNRTLTLEKRKDNLENSQENTI